MKNGRNRYKDCALYGKIWRSIPFLSDFRGEMGNWSHQMRFSSNDIFVKERVVIVMDITICIGSSCHLKGSQDIIRILERLVSYHHLEDKITLKGSFCMGECTTNGVCVDVDGTHFKLTPAETESFFTYEVMKRLENS